ncbi:MAG: hypothetical protein AB7U82_31635 [Blastocatellales bacterium]
MESFIVPAYAGDLDCGDILNSTGARIIGSAYKAVKIWSNHFDAGLRYFVFSGWRQKIALSKPLISREIANCKLACERATVMMRSAIPN